MSRSVMSRFGWPLGVMVATLVMTMTSVVVAEGPVSPRRKRVLVELFTSQG